MLTLAWSGVFCPVMTLHGSLAARCCTHDNMTEYGGQGLQHHTQDIITHWACTRSVGAAAFVRD